MVLVDYRLPAMKILPVNHRLLTGHSTYSFKATTSKKNSMKLSPASLGIGVGIGAIAVVIPMIFSLALPTKNTDEIEASFSIGGYVKDVSEDTLTISQSQREDWLESEEVAQRDIHINLTRGAIIDLCGNPDDSSVAECAEAFRSGNVLVGTSVCAGVRLIDGELYGGRIFFNMTCDYPPRVPIS